MKCETCGQEIVIEEPKGKTLVEIFADEIPEPDDPIIDV